MSTKKKRKPACYCGLTLLDDGACRYGCPKKSPRAEMREMAAKRRANERASVLKTGISEAERKRASDAIGKMDPLYGPVRQRLAKAARLSHAPGSRR